MYRIRNFGRNIKKSNPETIKVKLRNSGVQSKAGTIYYQHPSSKNTPDCYMHANRSRKPAVGGSH